MATVFSTPRAARTLVPSHRRTLTTNRSDGVFGGAETTRFVSGAIYDWAELGERFAELSRERRDDRLVLFRHGATNYNDRNLVSGQHDTALSDEGRRQAEGLAATVPATLDLIACSALGRAIQTMELAIPAARRRGIPVFIDPRLNEVHLGDLQGRRRRHLPEFEAGDLDFAPPNGETYREAAARVFSAVADLFALLAHQGDRSSAAEAMTGPRTAAIFCHAGVLRIVATLTSGSDDPKDVFRKTLGNAERLEIDAGAVTVSKYWGKS